MPWKEKTIMFQKEEFIRQVLSENDSFLSLCNQFNISRTTGYKLVKKYNCEGRKGLLGSSRAPLSIPHKTSQEITDKILSVRIKHTTWGARKIRTYLIKQNIKSLPASSTISEILKRNGLVSKEESLKRQELTRRILKNSV